MNVSGGMTAEAGHIAGVGKNRSAFVRGMRPRRRLSSWAIICTVLSVLVLALTACSETSEPQAPAGSDVQVFASASMKPVAEELGEAFRREHDGVELVFNFGGSSDLVRQIDQGAPADLLISADNKNMDKALAGQDFQDSEATVIATNRLVLALPAGNPAHIESLEDLPGKRVAICAPEVPCGTIAHQVLREQKIDLDNPSEEANVADVSTKVSTGAVDAGFVYSTDARAMAGNGVTSVNIDGVQPNQYPEALTSQGQENPSAVAFAEWLRGEKAQKILAEHGFGPAN